MDMVYNNGQMEQNMKVCGLMEKLQVKENLHMLMEIHLKDNGIMIKLMGMESISILKLEKSIKEIGKKI
jgi:hypothetical protein